MRKKEGWEEGLNVGEVAASPERWKQFLEERGLKKALVRA